ncbi:trimeric intracellular cation channel family protein [Microlunatus sp. Gsoil 973]|uniref:trimeric intracellular cation channel family protein n=1 Tax=Microlunatus sp. Gsoil 973 TaxID=2672569 RepID=UPI001E3FCE06|nr:TRIC cation channel family protein [Microlunatus sp. Gsoil 973]
MDVPVGFDPRLILGLNLVGTFVFGLSGGLAAVRARLDLLGVVVLAGVVALAGGVIRDLLIGVPPATFRDWRYLAAAGIAGLVCFLAGSVLLRVERGVMVFDAFGLSLFAVTGATKALQSGLGPVQAVLLGMITGIGGGMVRDLLLREVPTVLREGLYAVPAMLGAAVLVLGHEIGSTSPLFPTLGALVCVIVRLLGVRYGIRLPSAGR